MKIKVLSFGMLIAFAFWLSTGFKGINGSDTFLVPEGWPKTAYNFEKNPLSRDKIELGRKLFYDPVLSRTNTISCASCHLSYSSFTHIDHAVSHGIYDSMGTRNAPVLINLAWGKSFMWDGAINNIEVQPLAPVSHPLEMGETIGHVIEKLQHSGIYPQLFQNAFGDSIISCEHFLKALAQFQLSLVSANAKYDQVKRHEASFSEQEMHGYQLFQQHCNSCHAEPLFTSGAFANNGLPMDTVYHDYGRCRVSLQPEDSFKFKIPTLRNIEYSYPYMHDGRFKTLSQVLKHYSSGIKASPTLAPELKGGIALAPNDQVDIIAFLLTLSDSSFIFNPAFAYPKK
jgi:cytochrome c peroxidase